MKNKTLLLLLVLFNFQLHAQKPIKHFAYNPYSEIVTELKPECCKNCEEKKQEINFLNEYIYLHAIDSSHNVRLNNFIQDYDSIRKQFYLSQNSDKWKLLSIYEDSNFYGTVNVPGVKHYNKYYDLTYQSVNLTTKDVYDLFNPIDSIQARRSLYFEENPAYHGKWMSLIVPKTTENGLINDVLILYFKEHYTCKPRVYEVKKRKNKRKKQKKDDVDVYSIFKDGSWMGTHQKIFYFIKEN